MVEKEMSNNDLARMIAEGFSSVDKRFASVDKRFDSVDKKFVSVDKRLEEMDDQIGSINKTLVVVEDDISTINLQLKQITPAQVRIAALETHVGAMQKQTDQIQLQMQSA